MSAAWLSDKDLAERYGIHRITVWNWTRQGRLPSPVKLSPQTTRWSAAEIEAHDQEIIEASTSARFTGL